MRPGEYHIVRDDAGNVLVVPSGSTLLDDPVTTLSGPKATFGRTPPDTSTLSAGSPTPSERGTSSCGPSTSKVSVGGTSAQSQRPTRRSPKCVKRCEGTSSSTTRSKQGPC